MNYYVENGNPVQEFWFQNYTSRFLDIIYAHQDKVIYCLGSHIHRVAIKAPLSTNHTGLSLKIFASPSISPVYDNNPGYTFLTLGSDLKVEDFHMKFLRLYTLDYFFGVRVWTEF